MANIQKKIDEGLYPKDIRDAVERWDRGDSVWTVEMGGLGPGYEQAIAVGMIELMRSILDVDLPKEGENWNEFLNDRLLKISKEFNLQLSGAQAGAIINLTAKFATRGWLATEEVQDRMIQISKHWPGHE